MSEYGLGRTSGGRFVAIITDPLAYRGMLYLLIGFPLGVIYFVLMVTGFSLGISLLIIWVGIPILVGVLLLARLLGAMERALANRLLTARIRPLPSVVPGTLWERLKGMVASGTTWRSVAYLFAKFPLGIAGFVILTTLLGTSLALLFAPFYYNLPYANIGVVGVWEVDTLGVAVILSLVGALLFIASLHALKWTAFAFGRVARWMLGG